jgi:hypothetical protein
MGASLVVGVPIVLTHSGQMNPFQLGFALPAAALMGGTAVAYDHFRRTSDGEFGGYDGI